MAIVEKIIGHHGEVVFDAASDFLSGKEGVITNVVFNPSGTAEDYVIVRLVYPTGSVRRVKLISMDGKTPAAWSNINTVGICKLQVLGTERLINDPTLAWLSFEFK